MVEEVTGKDLSEWRDLNPTNLDYEFLDRTLKGFGPKAEFVH